MDAAPPDNDSDDRYLKPFPARRLLPSDRFCGSDATVLDFWAWGFSDLRSDRDVNVSGSNKLIPRAINHA